MSVGTLIATILAEDEVSSDALTQAETEPVVSDQEQASDQVSEPITQEQDSHSGSPRVSPVARLLAEEHGVELQSIQGSGPSGRIIKRDVLQVIDTTSETTSAANTTQSEPTTPVVSGQATSPVQTNTSLPSHHL